MKKFKINWENLGELILFIITFISTLYLIPLYITSYALYNLIYFALLVYVMGIAVWTGIDIWVKMENL